jgi:plastocyanin
MKLIAAPLALLALTAGCSRPAAQAPAEKKAPSYFTVDAATAGTLRGKIVFKGRKPLPTPLRIDEDPACVQLNQGRLLEESLLINTAGAMPNVFVYVKAGLAGKQFAPPPADQIVTIDQRNCRFAPHVIGLRVGQLLRITNSDPVTHNIHPQPQMNREWNQSQEPGAPALERKFVRPEIMMRVKCNVHSWMRAYVSALEHPYFAVTGSDGAFEIPNLPPGEYTVEAWQEKLGKQELAVTLAASETKPANFVFTGASAQP